MTCSPSPETPSDMVLYTTPLHNTSSANDSPIQSAVTVAAQTLEVAQHVQQRSEETKEPMSRQKITFSTLTTGVILLIADHLHATESACLALAFKPFYPFHRTKYGKVSLSKCPRDLNDPGISVLLAGYFPGLVFYAMVNKFIPLSQRDALELERFDDYRRGEEALSLSLLHHWRRPRKLRKEGWRENETGYVER